MKTEEFVCVVCPNGCFIEATYKKGESGAPSELFEAKGYACPRGETWIMQEIENPVRTIAGSVTVRGGDFPCASVRTKKPIPLSKVRDVMDVIRKLRPKAPLTIGDVLQVNPAGAETEIIVTRTVRRKETV